MYHVVIYKATREPKVVPPPREGHTFESALEKAQTLYQSYVELFAGGFAPTATAILVVDDAQLEKIQNGGFAAKHQYGPI